MSEPRDELLSEISDKLDTLIALMKIGNRNALEEYRQRISDDKVYSKIMETLQEPLTHGDLCKKVADELAMAEITVRKKIAELKNWGLLKTVKKGREVYYEKSGLVD